MLDKLSLVDMMRSYHVLLSVAMYLQEVKQPGFVLLLVHVIYLELSLFDEMLWLYIYIYKFLS
jgi:hypothetical protein